MSDPTMTPARRLGVAAASLFAAIAPLAGPAPSAAAAPCPDVEVVFARGTSEPAGIGRVGQALADTLQSQLGGRTVGAYGVNYPGHLRLPRGRRRRHRRDQPHRWPRPRRARRPASCSAATRRAPRWSTCCSAFRRWATRSATSARPRRCRRAWPARWRRSPCSATRPPSSATRSRPRGSVRRQGDRPVQRRRPDLLAGSQPVRAHRLREHSTARPGRGLRRRTSL